MDAEVSSRIGAEYGERSPERVTQRNGNTPRLKTRRRSERALLAVIQQAYVEGVSTRRGNPISWTIILNGHAGTAPTIVGATPVVVARGSLEVEADSLGVFIKRLF